MDPATLRDRKVTLNQVINTAGNAQVVSPLTFLEASTPGTGGFVETPQQRLQVRHLLEKIANPDELAKVPVEGTSGALKLGDVADIKVDHQPLIGDAVVNGKPGLILVVEKFPGVSTTQVTRDVQQALETLRPGLSGIETDTSWFAPADYVEAAKSNLGLAVALGAGLLLLALAALRFHWRAALVGVITVPLSVITAALIVNLLGYGFNALVIAGLAAAVAIVVDEAIAPGAAIVQRLRSSACRPGRRAQMGRNSAGSRDSPSTTDLCRHYCLARHSSRGGAGGAARSVLYADGPRVRHCGHRRLDHRGHGRPGPEQPALRPLGAKEAPERGPVPWLGVRYRSAVQRFSGSLRPALLVTAACGLVAVAILPFVHTALTPTFQDRNVVVRLQGQPDVSSEAMSQRAADLGNTIRALPGITGIGATVGRAVTGDRVVNVNSSDVWVSIAPDANYKTTLAAIENAARQVPARRLMSSPIRPRRCAMSGVCIPVPTL